MSPLVPFDDAILLSFTELATEDFYLACALSFLGNLDDVSFTILLLGSWVVLLGSLFADFDVVIDYPKSNTDGILK